MVLYGSQLATFLPRVFQETSSGLRSAATHMMCVGSLGKALRLLEWDIRDLACWYAPRDASMGLCLYQETPSVFLGDADIRCLGHLYLPINSFSNITPGIGAIIPHWVRDEERQRWVKLGPWRPYISVMFSVWWSTGFQLQGYFTFLAQPPTLWS